MADIRPYQHRGIGFAVTSWFLAILGGAGAFLFGSAAARSTGSCLPDETLFPCTETGRDVVHWLPPLGWLAAILLAWAIGAALSRRGAPRWPAVVAGVAGYAVVMTADWFLAVR
ncbi:hypothetical protein [Amycolatopsis sp. MEPSY49]|uniref:hypothetical protein n=1 Tax=Amycolatopsis sp. MEPSY49 TaxID=3151600 RepID=UPI003EF2EB6D